MIENFDTGQRINWHSLTFQLLDGQVSFATTARAGEVLKSAVYLQTVFEAGFSNITRHSGATHASIQMAFSMVSLSVLMKACGLRMQGIIAWRITRKSYHIRPASEKNRSLLYLQEAAIA